MSFAAPIVRFIAIIAKFSSNLVLLLLYKNHDSTLLAFEFPFFVFVSFHSDIFPYAVVVQKNVFQWAVLFLLKD